MWGGRSAVYFLKSFELNWIVAFLLLLVAAVLQALLFAIVLPRVKGITFALVTLGLASVFWIVIQSSDLAEYAGAEVGLQGVDAPIWFLDTTNHRFAFYLVTLGIVVLTYLAYTKIVDAPAGRVFSAIRENEGVIAGTADQLGLRNLIGTVSNCRSVTKSSMLLNDYQPEIEVDPQNYRVKADGQLLMCEPAEVLPMAQRYFLF